MRKYFLMSSKTSRRGDQRHSAHPIGPHCCSEVILRGQPKKIPSGLIARCQRGCKGGEQRIRSGRLVVPPHSVPKELWMAPGVKGAWSKDPNSWDKEELDWMAGWTGTECSAIRLRGVQSWTQGAFSWQQHSSTSKLHVNYEAVVCEQSLRTGTGSNEGPLSSERPIGRDGTSVPKDYHGTNFKREESKWESNQKRGEDPGVFPFYPGVVLFIPFYFFL